MRTWSDSDIAILRRDYARLGPKVLGEQLGRTRGSVRDKATKLGLTAPIRSRWSAEELEYLRLHYKQDGAKAVAKQIKRSLDSVQGKAFDLGFTRRQMLPRRYWTPEEDTKLEDLAARMSAIQVAKTLKRSYHAVRNRAHDLGFRFAEQREWYTTGDVAQILGASTQYVLTAVLGGRLKAERLVPTDVRSGKTYGRKWRIEYADLREFIVDNKATFTGFAPDWVALFDVLGVK